MITCQEKPKIGEDTILVVNVKLKTFKCEQVGQVKSPASETDANETDAIEADASESLYEVSDEEFPYTVLHQSCLKTEIGKLHSRTDRQQSYYYYCKELWQTCKRFCQNRITKKKISKPKFIQSR